MRTERELPRRLARAMRERLGANRHKSGWWAMTPLQSLRRAEQELGELRRAVARGVEPREVWREAGDVANFLAFAAEVSECQPNGGPR